MERTGLIFAKTSTIMSQGTSLIRYSLVGIVSSDLCDSFMHRTAGPIRAHLGLTKHQCPSERAKPILYVLILWAYRFTLASKPLQRLCDIAGRTSTYVMRGRTLLLPSITSSHSAISYQLASARTTGVRFITASCGGGRVLLCLDDTRLRLLRVLA